MNKKIIAYDLGTSAVKAALFESDGTLVAHVDRPYKTFYPHIGWHEQRPEDWWKAIVISTRELIGKSKIDPKSIVALGLSGHSFGVVPVDKEGNLLRELTPIWSDMRAKEQGNRFLKKISLDDWYQITSGFMIGCYAFFKIMWYMDNEPDMIDRTYKILGTKDYINYLLTGRMLTDYSYASGSGVYNLHTNQYSSELIKLAGIDADLLPEIVPSTQIIGELTWEAANELGLDRNTQVVCGGVDNSCMALGARGTKDGCVYTNLGSSAWIAITSSAPILDLHCYPNVFAHVIPGMYNSAVTIFSAGNAFRWVRDVICGDLVELAEDRDIDPYELMSEMAGRSPVGANKLIFNPTLAMGGQLDSSLNTKGAFTGLDLKHTREDILRAAMEGITLSLGTYLDELSKLYPLSEEMLLVGGGSNSGLWRQIFADIYNMKIVQTNIGQNAGALGAAGVAAVGSGLWSDFSVMDSIHQIMDIKEPNRENKAIYDKIRPIYKFVSRCQAEIGDKLFELN